MDAPKKVKVREVRLYSRPASLRMPFHFGNAKIEYLECALLRTIVEDEHGTSIPGIGATIFSPMWFEKNPEKSFEERQRALEDSIAQAARLYQSHDGAPAWKLHQEIENETRRINTNKRFNDLTAGFGCALLDSAVIDAVCRATDQGIRGAITTNSLGLGPELPTLLPETPPKSLNVRHTLGLVDALQNSELSDPLKDGLPQSLEEVIDEYGIRWFKLKISADTEAVLARLREVSVILNKKLGIGNYQVTIDANEAFHTPVDFLSFLDEYEGDQALATLRKQVLWIEQPLHRDNALKEDLAEELHRMNSRIPVIIDESNGTDDAFEKAITLGYRGVSAKNCKGPFRTLKNFEIIQRHNSQSPENPLYLSSEDLTNLPVLPLHQDLCVAGTLGISHTERNGHHFVKGLEFLELEESRWALENYPELYVNSDTGCPHIRIENGAINVDRILETGYGGDFEPAWSLLDEIQLNNAN